MPITKKEGKRKTEVKIKEYFYKNMEYYRIYFFNFNKSNNDMLVTNAKVLITSPGRNYCLKKLCRHSNPGQSGVPGMEAK